MASQGVLLDDDAMRQFVVSGAMILKSSRPPEFHEELAVQLEKANRDHPNPRSGIVEAVPALRDVYDDPPIKGALQSILGADMRMHPYTLSHCNPPGFPAQLWHQGSAYNRPRHIWRLMVFYFPLPVSYEMGPTFLVPGTQYRTIANTDLYRYGSFVNQMTSAVGEVGTLLVMHYDLWHRGTANHGTQTRYMVKTVFERTSAPRSPSWNASPHSNSPEALVKFRTLGVQIDSETEAYKNQERWIEIWKWYHGEEYRNKDWFPEYLP